MVSGSAFVWSIGGAIWRFLSLHDSRTVVFWRSTVAALFLLFGTAARQLRARNSFNVQQYGVGWHCGGFFVLPLHQQVSWWC